MIGYWWIKAENGKSGTIAADGIDHAKTKGAEIIGSPIESAATLPYPATPMLEELECPPFCYSPRECAGRMSCPHSWACSN